MLEARAIERREFAAAQLALDTACKRYNDARDALLKGGPK
jgi:hypothetical protein